MSNVSQPSAGAVGTTSATPLYVQAEQQIVASEISIYGGTATNPENAFDKDTTTVSLIPAGLNTYSAGFTHPILVSRVIIKGGLNDVYVYALTADGIAVAIPNMGDIANPFSVVDGVDSGNFEPIPIEQIIIEQVVASPGSAVAEIVILKAIETKTYEQKPALIEFYGQKVYYDPLDIAGTPYAELLLRIPMEVDADDKPLVNLDLTATTITNDAVDADRITVQFHCPHPDIITVKDIARVMATVEASANAHVASVKFRVGKKNIVTDVLTWLIAEETITDPIAGNICDAGQTRRVTANLQEMLRGFLGDDEVLVFQVVVNGAQDAPSATPARVRLRHGRGEADTKFEVSVVER